MAAPAEMLFLYQLDLKDLVPDQSLIPGIPPELRGGRRVRVGRGGRLLIDRWTPPDAQPFDPRSFVRQEQYGNGLGVAGDTKAKAPKVAAVQ